MPGTSECNGEQPVVHNKLSTTSEGSSDCRNPSQNSILENTISPFQKENPNVFSKLGNIGAEQVLEQRPSECNGEQRVVQSMLLVPSNVNIGDRSPSEKRFEQSTVFPFQPENRSSNENIELVESLPSDNGMPGTSECNGEQPVVHNQLSTISEGSSDCRNPSQNSTERNTIFPSGTEKRTELSEMATPIVGSEVEHGTTEGMEKRIVDQPNVVAASDKDPARQSSSESASEEEEKFPAGKENRKKSTKVDGKGAEMTANATVKRKRKLWNRALSNRQLLLRMLDFSSDEESVLLQPTVKKKKVKVKGRARLLQSEDEMDGASDKSSSEEEVQPSWDGRKRYAIHKITNFRTVFEHLEFHVKWKGYKNPEHDTWESERTLLEDGMEHFIEAFHASIGSKRQKSLLIQSSTQNNCYLLAINLVAKLLKVDNYISPEVIDFLIEDNVINADASGVTRKTLILILQRIRAYRKLHRLPRRLYCGERKDNLIRSTTKGYKEVPHNGVFLCTAVTIHGKGHAFVLHKTDSGVTAYLEGEQAEPEAYGPEWLNWLKMWQMMVECEMRH